MEKWQRVNYQPNIPLGEDGRRITASLEHRMLSKEAAKEGMVLLKNEQDILPLTPGTKVALFGKASFDYVKGGGGSGDVTVEYTVNLHDGLKAHVSLFDELSDFYKNYVSKEYEKGTLPGLVVEPKVPEDLLVKARRYTNTAIITLCRFSGEGWDRKSSSKEMIDYNWPEEREMAKISEAIFEDGDFYLTKSEADMIHKVKNAFKDVIVVMNVGGMVDTQWFVEDREINSVLMAWQSGIEGGNAAAELLVGLGNPSGKLVDTFAKELGDYPSTDSFHESNDYVDYLEDIYVGYRYFETIAGAADKVNYPFGFGLSYTDFSWKEVESLVEGILLTVRVDVTNIGNREGKEVIQLYIEAPQGVLGKSKRILAGFKKTRLLKVGETQSVVLRVDMDQIASYDDLGKCSKSAYILEKGDYKAYIGTSVRDTIKVSAVYTEESNRVVQQLTSRLVPTSLEKRMLADGSYEVLPQTKANDPDACGLEKMSPQFTEGVVPAVSEQKRYRLWGDESRENIPKLNEVAKGSLSLDEFVEQMSDEEVASLLGGQPNTGVANTFGFGNMEKYKIPNVMTADGPAGLRITPDRGVTTTAWPCATLLACTWDESLLYRIGEAGAMEVKENNLGLWLAPAVNIHRSPLCGRNFEYYSEDPLVAGKLAASLVRGMQSKQIGASVKHFALNNKETNRKNSDSRVSERAAREIYLKAFEIIVKEAKPWSIMSSYNIINGHRASENKDLLQGILRDEWGFEGFVTTDWWTFGEHYKEVLAGNDLKMASGFPERLMEAKEKGLITRADMEICAKRILKVIIKLD